MKFEAEIIKEIVDSRGHTKTSIHYQSECVEEWVKEVEGAYPKLCDYQPEWLNYSAENKIGVFPYVTLTDVTSSTLENVVPYAYKRAVLSGNTLVNLATPIEYKNIMYHGYCLVFNGSMLKSGEYTLKSSVDFSKYVINLLATQKDSPAQYKRITISKNGVFTINDTFFVANEGQAEDFYICLRPIDNTEGGTVTTNEIEYCEIILLEGNHADNDIPYFEGMQSVKMPVLTTTNADSTKSNILSTPSDLELCGIGDVKDTLDCLTGEVTQRIGEYIIDGNENWAIYELYTFEGYKSFITTITGLDNLYTVANTFISGDFKMESWNGYRNGAEGEFVWNHDPNRIGIKVKNETVSNVEELKTFLASNPIRFKYELATESFKTVDLSVVDQDGKTLERIKPIEGTMHLTTSGETIKPLFSGEVPVEAITQNLASFIEE